MSSALEIVREHGMAAIHQMTPEKRELLKRTVCKGASDDELDFALARAAHMGLDPFNGEVTFYKQSAKEGDRWVQQLVMVPTIKGARTVAERSGDYDGQEGPWWCGEDGIWHDVWLDKDPPRAAKIQVFSKKLSRPITQVVRFSSFAKYTKEGRLQGLWAAMPDHMIAKVAETHALRRAFPGTYKHLEIGDGEEDAFVSTIVEQEVEEAIAGELAARTEETREVTWQDENKRLHAAGRALGMDHEAIKGWFNVEQSLTDLSAEQLGNMADSLEAELERMDENGTPVIEAQAEVVEGPPELDEELREANERAIQTWIDGIKKTHDEKELLGIGQEIGKAGFTRDSHPDIFRAYKARMNQLKIANRGNQPPEAREIERILQ